MSIKFKITGLDCANCAAELERKIQKIDGITKASISFMAQRLQVEYEGNDEEEMIKEMRKVIKKEEPDVNIDKI